MKNHAWLFVLAFLVSCSSVPKDTGDDAHRLGIAIRLLSPMVDPEEARQAAAMMTKESIQLAEDYDAVEPAWFHNVLVNSGLRERGLCYHWVNDLVLL